MFIIITISGTNILRIATVPILSSAECIKWHKSKDIHVEIYPEMICAGKKKCLYFALFKTKKYSKYSKFYLIKRLSRWTHGCLFR